MSIEFKNSRPFRIPGLIDTHVHGREPGGNKKEDFVTLTMGAAAGGVTQVSEMPNTQEADAVTPHFTNTSERLDEKEALIPGRTFVDMSLYVRLDEVSLPYLPSLVLRSCGGKLYAGETTGGHAVTDHKLINDLHRDHPKNRRIVYHAPDQMLDFLLWTALDNDNIAHLTHLANRYQLELVLEYRKKGLDITTDVTMHHITFTKNDLPELGPLGIMMPELQTEENKFFLRYYVAHDADPIYGKAINAIASDHAPHEPEAKVVGAFGIPGLETTGPLALKMVAGGEMEMDRFVDLMHNAPLAIYGFNDQGPDTYIEGDLNDLYTIGEDGKDFYTKCNWSSFTGLEAVRIQKTVLRGELVFDGEKIVGEPRGKLVYPKLA